MTVTTYTGWVADGKPAKPAQPIADMVAMFQRHGYVCGYYPDDRHLLASTPEDHCPYSHTSWPGSQPYPYILALDLMPHVEGDGKSLAPIARRIIADVDGGRAPWIKYINWTDEQGHCWHTKWQANKVTSTSSDSGHVHISIRTDYVTSTAAAGWDPVTPTSTGADMEQTEALIRDTGYKGRLVGDVFADLANLRNFLYAAPGESGLVNPPPAGSVADLLAKFVAAPPAGAAVDVDALAAKIAAALIASNANGLTAADHAGIVADVKSVFAQASG